MKTKLLLLNNTKDLKFEDATGKFSGYASKFGGVDSYGDTILKGAFKKTLVDRERPIKMRWNHWGPIIGKWLVIEEDEKGLYVEGELTPDHSVASDVYASLKHGAIDGMSIGGWWNGDENDHGGIDIEEAKLSEISIVEDQADMSATVDNIKSAIEKLDNIKDIESFMRDAFRLSKNATQTLISRIKHTQSDSSVIDDKEVIEIDDQSDSDVIDCGELLKSDLLLNFHSRERIAKKGKLL